jgi:membrane protein DedA with SNARE-associated domain
VTPTNPWTLFWICLISGLLMPVPEDVALLWAGWLIREQELRVQGALIAGVFGVFFRDWLAFGFGRFLATRVEHYGWGRKLIGSEKVVKAHAILEKHGFLALILTRLAVGMRVPLFFAAGLLQYQKRAFVLVDGLGVLVTTPLTLYLGWYFGEEATALLKVLLANQRVVIVLLLCSLVLDYYLIKWWKARKLARSQRLE